MHAPIPAAFSLFFLPLSFLLSILFLLLISNCYLAVGCFSHLGLFPFGSPSLGAYYSLTMVFFFPQVLLPPWVPFFRCFSLFPCFSSHSISSPLFSAVVTFLLQRTDLMGFLPFTPRDSPTIFGLLQASFQDYSLTHWLPLPLLSTYLLHRYSFHDKIPFLFIPVVYLYLTAQLYGMHQMVPTIYYFFWVRYHPSRIYSQKKSWQETKYRPPFPPTTKPRLLNPLDRGPTSLVLAGYRLVVLRPFCACSTVFCVCLPRRFCRSRLALFRSTVCFCLISSCVSCCVCLFLQFGFSFLHTFSVANTSCCFLFLFIVPFYISFHSYLLYKRIQAFVGQITQTGSKGSWAQFVFVY